MDLEYRFQLIKRNTQEIVTEEELKNLLKNKKKPSVFWGWSITGRPHIGYFVPVLKLADFLKAGFKVKLLLADIHGALDKTPWDVLEHRFQHYKNTILLMFKAINSDLAEFEIVKGSDFQLSKNYWFDVLKLSTYTSVNEARHAGSEVVKSSDNPKLSSLMYPLMQALDEEYLQVDIQGGGIDQRKILMFARENLSRLGYKRRIEVMTPLIPGLLGKKMSASEPASKIDLLYSPQDVKQKLHKAHCPEGVVEDNGVLAFLKYVIMVLKEDLGEPLVVERPANFGGNIVYKTYLKIEEDFVKKQLHPLDLKMAVAKEINKLLKPFQKQKGKLEKIAKLGYN